MGLSDPADVFMANLARRRAQQDALNQQMQSAAQQVQGTLQGAATQQKADEREQAAQALRLRQVSDEEKQTEASNQMRLREITNAENQTAASNAFRLRELGNEDTRTAIDRENADRAKKTAEDAENDKQRIIQSGKVANAAAAYARAKGPAAANLDEFSSSLLGRTDLGQLQPEDVQHLLDDAVHTERGTRLQAAIGAMPAGASPDADALAKIAADTGASLDEVKAAAQTKIANDAKAALPAQQATETARHNKAQEGIEWQRNKNELEKAKLEAATKLAEGNKAVDTKNIETTQQVEGFRQNIKDNIQALKAQIDATGTFEMSGTANTDMERRLNSIATDLAKLADPQSVARPTEVEEQRKGLFEPGMLTRDKTAKDTLDHLLAEVDKRADNAYAVRGMKKPAGASAAPPTSTGDADKAHADAHFGGG